MWISRQIHMNLNSREIDVNEICLSMSPYGLPATMSKARTAQTAIKGPEMTVLNNSNEKN